MCFLPIQLQFINPFHATGLFRYPLKISQNQMFSDVFRGYRKRPVAWNELNDKSKILFFIKFGDCMLISGQKQPPEVFYKKAILKIQAIFTRKHLCWSLIFLLLRGGFSKFDICTIGYCLVYYKENITSKVEFNT